MTVTVPKGVDIDESLLKKIITECDFCNPCDGGTTVTCDGAGGQQFFMPNKFNIRFTPDDPSCGYCVWPRSFLTEGIIGVTGDTPILLATASTSGAIESGRQYELSLCSGPLPNMGCCKAVYSFGNLTISDVTELYGFGPSTWEPFLDYGCPRLFSFVGTEEFDLVGGGGECLIHFRVHAYISMVAILPLSKPGYCSTDDYGGVASVDIHTVYVVENDEGGTYRDGGICVPFLGGYLPVVVRGFVDIPISAMSAPAGAGTPYCSGSEFNPEVHTGPNYGKTINIGACFNAAGAGGGDVEVAISV